ncbi:MAG: ABC transporter substrate binding protein [Pseudomonadota bacterium]
MKVIRLLVIILAGTFMFSIGEVSWAEQKKVLFVDSYHEGYAWSDTEVAGAKAVLINKADFKVVRMDTKRNPGEEFKKAAAEKVKAEIQIWKPDVVILADDNAAKYVYVPFYKESSIPFVSCGVNWTFAKYGIPSNNATGVQEVSVINPLLDQLKKFAKGGRYGFLACNNESDRIESEEIAKRANIVFEAIKLVNTFQEWKAAFLELQGQTDMIFCQNNAGIQDWDALEAIKFVRENTKVPTGSAHDFMAPYVFTCYAKLGEEQGEVAGNMALDILNGKPVKDIPPTVNKKGQVYLNLAIAKKLGIQLSLESIKAAKVIKE